MFVKKGVKMQKRPKISLKCRFFLLGVSVSLLDFSLPRDEN